MQLLLLPLITLLFLAKSVMHPAPLLPALPADIFDPTIECQSLGEQSSSASKMDIDFSIGDMMNFFDPTIGAACDSSSGVMTPDAAEANAVNPEQALWQLYQS